MKYFVKRYSFLVIAQTFCLALGLWLEHSFLVSYTNSNIHAKNPADPVDRMNEASDTDNKLASEITSSSDAKHEIPVMAVRATALLWIAAIQAVIAYLVLTREQEENARKNQRVEKISLQQYNDLLRTRDAVIFGLAKLAESRDPDTGKHLERIAIYSTRLASALQYEPSYRDQATPSFVKLIGISSALHDIGKVGVRDSILLKPGKLEQQERVLMQMHSAIGGKCIREIESHLGRSNFLEMAREIAFGHHENWDGTGYPKGLAGEEIPLAARIVAIADVYDALYTKRIYKDAYPHKECVEMISSKSGIKFDPVLVKIFLKLESDFHDIAQSYRDATEEACPESASTEETPFPAAEAVIAPDDQFEEIQTILEECAGESLAVKESLRKIEDSTSLNCEPSHSL